jgi:hypothetical protein
MNIYCVHVWEHGFHRQCIRCRAIWGFNEPEPKNVVIATTSEYITNAEKQIAGLDQRGL